MEENLSPPGNQNEEGIPISASLNFMPQNIADGMTFPTVLHYLHNEWRRFERERNEWELEKSDLKARIVFLEGERRGAELLKNDLVKRIKMLEFALKQERQKQLNSPRSETKDKPIAEIPLKPPESPKKSIESQMLIRSMTLGKGKTLNKTREILKQYLQEVGFEDESNGQEKSNSFSQYSTLPAKIAQEKQPNKEQKVPPAKPPPFQDNGKELSPEEMQEFEKELMKSNKISSEKTKKMMKNWNAMFQTKGMTSNTIIQSSPAANIHFTVKKPDTKELDSELADLSLNASEMDDEKTSTVKSISSSANSASSEIKNWKPKFSLKSHWDSVRCVQFHPNDPILVSGSEDGTIKYWNLGASLKMKKTPVDIEPIYTFRMNENPINSLCLSTMTPTDLEDHFEFPIENGLIYSAGYDGKLYAFALPDPSLGVYSAYDYQRYHLHEQQIHSDIVWDLKLHPILPLLASCGADGFVNIWNLNQWSEDDGFQKKTKISHTSSLLPTSIDFIQQDLKKVAVAFQTAKIQVFDLEAGKVVLKDFKGSSDNDIANDMNHINQLKAHPTMPILVSAHENRIIKFYDLRSGDVQHSMIAHLDSVSCLDISPNGLVLASGGHDSSVRFWDFSAKACIQEFSSHRKKYDEAVHSIQFHPRLLPNSSPSNDFSSSGQTSPTSGISSVSGGSGFFSTCGADSCIKIYTC